MLSTSEDVVKSSWNVTGKNDAPVVSVICIAYNHELYIEQCLDGILAQKTSFPFEIIVHDDASTDNTAEIIKKYESRYPTIIKAIYQSVNQYSQGESIVDKLLDSYCEGKYIAFCEGDDFWVDCYKLQLQYEALEKNQNCSICTTLVRCCKENGQELELTIPKDVDLFKKSGIIRKCGIANLIWKKKTFPFHLSSYFIRKDVLTLTDALSEYLFLDIAILRRCLTCGDFYYINKIMSVRRMDAINGWSSNYRRSGKNTMIKVLDNNFYMDLATNDVLQGTYNKYIYPVLVQSYYKAYELRASEAIKLRNECEKTMGQKMFRRYCSAYVAKLSRIKRVLVVFSEKMPHLFSTVCNIKWALRWIYYRIPGLYQYRLKRK